MNKISIALGADHAGFDYKEKIKNYLLTKGIEVKDFGCYSHERADYPDYVHPLAKAIDSKEYSFGILVCGSGNGVNITANKYQKVRSALCWNVEIAKLAREHNDANIIAVPARFVSEETAMDMIEIFITTSFEGGRHADRVNKIPVPNN